jgi:hypothetical protein
VRDLGVGTVVPIWWRGRGYPGVFRMWQAGRLPYDGSMCPTYALFVLLNFPALSGWDIFSRVYDACQRVILQRRCAVLLLILAADAAGQLLFKG